MSTFSGPREKLPAGTRGWVVGVVEKGSGDAGAGVVEPCANGAGSAPYMIFWYSDGGCTRPDPDAPGCPEYDAAGGPLSLDASPSEDGTDRSVFCDGDGLNQSNTRDPADNSTGT